MWFANSALISRDYTDGNHHTKVMFVVDIVAQEHNYILVVNKNKVRIYVVLHLITLISIID